MAVPWRTVAVAAVAFLVGIPAAFFFAFNAVFTDASGAGERAFAVALVALVYAIGGALCGLVAPKAPLATGIAFCLPALLILALYTTREPQSAVLHLLVASAASVPCLLLAWLVGAWRRSRAAARPPLGP